MVVINFTERGRLPNMNSISNNMMHASSYQKIKDVYNHEETNELPFIIGDVNYWLSNDSPKDYFDNPNSMLNYQKTKIDYHLANIKDDYISLIFPWFGTGAIPSKKTSNSYCFAESSRN